MVGELPASVSFGTVEGRFVVATADGADGGTDPDGGAATGTVTFTPSVTYVKVAGATPPTSVSLRAIECTLDSDGILNDPIGNNFVKLIATDDADLDPVGWTWDVTIALTDETPRSFSIAVPAGGTIDLTTLAPVASSSGDSTLAHSEREAEVGQVIPDETATIILWPTSAVAERGGITHNSLTGVWTVGVTGTYQVTLTLTTTLTTGYGLLDIRKDAATVGSRVLAGGAFPWTDALVATFDADADAEIDVRFYQSSGDAVDVDAGYATIHRLA